MCKKWQLLLLSRLYEFLTTSVPCCIETVSQISLDYLLKEYLTPDVHFHLIHPSVCCFAMPVYFFQCMPSLLVISCTSFSFAYRVYRTDLATGLNLNFPRPRKLKQMHILTLEACGRMERAYYTELAGKNRNIFFLTLSIICLEGLQREAIYARRENLLWDFHRISLSLLWALFSIYQVPRQKHCYVVCLTKLFTTKHATMQWINIHPLIMHKGVLGVGFIQLILVMRWRNIQ